MLVLLTARSDSTCCRCSQTWSKNEEERSFSGVSTTEEVQSLLEDKMHLYVTYPVKSYENTTALVA